MTNNERAASWFEYVDLVDNCHEDEDGRYEVEPARGAIRCDDPLFDASVANGARLHTFLAFEGDVVVSTSASNQIQSYTGELKQPTLNGSKLTFYFPVPVPRLHCPILNCISTFLTYRGADESGYMQLDKLSRHLRNVHRIKIQKSVKICLICNRDLGCRPSSHECVKNLQLPNQTHLKYHCEFPGCGTTFAKSSDLLLHSKCHQETTTFSGGSGNKISMSKQKFDNYKEDMKLGRDGSDNSHDEDFRYDVEPSCDANHCDDDIIVEHSNSYLVANGAPSPTSKINVSPFPAVREDDNVPGTSSSTHKKRLYVGNLRDPILDGSKLTVYFPVPDSTLKCPISNCMSTFFAYKNGNTSGLLQLEKLVVHLYTVHMVKTSKPVKMCLICNKDTGFRPSSHHCLKNLQIRNQTILNYCCEFSGCGKAFRTFGCLLRHSLCHSAAASQSGSGVGNTMLKSKSAIKNNDTLKNPEKVLGMSDTKSRTHSCQPESIVTRGKCSAGFILSSETQPIIGIGPSASATKRLYTGEYRDPIVEGTKLNIYYPLPVPLLKCCRKDCTFACTTLDWDNKTHREIIEIFLKLQDHFEDEHGVTIAAIDTICLICEQTFVFSDAHECFQNLKFSNQAELKFRCESEGCGQAFPTLVALLHHSKIHYVSGDTNVDFATASKLLPKKGVSEEKSYKKKLSRVKLNPVPQNNATDESCHEDMELGSDDGGGDDSNDEDYQCESETTSDSNGGNGNDDSAIYQLEEEDIGAVVTNVTVKPCSLSIVEEEMSEEQLMSSRLPEIEGRGALPATSMVDDSSPHIWQDDDVAGSSVSNNQQMYDDILRQPTFDGHLCQRNLENALTSTVNEELDIAKDTTSSHKEGQYEEMGIEGTVGSIIVGSKSAVLSPSVDSELNKVAGPFSVPVFNTKWYIGEIRQPTLVDTKLTVYFPLPKPSIHCPQCSKPFNTESIRDNYESPVLGNLCSHICKQHDIKGFILHRICLVCKEPLMQYHNNHECLQNIQFPCEPHTFVCQFEGCNYSSLTALGLHNHSISKHHLLMSCNDGKIELEPAPKTDVIHSGRFSKPSILSQNESMSAGLDTRQVDKCDTISRALRAPLFNPALASATSDGLTENNAFPYSGFVGQPEIKGLKLIVYHPLPLPIVKCPKRSCQYAFCRFISNATSTNSKRDRNKVNHLRLHIIRKHKLGIKSVVNVCRICHQAFFSFITHSCLKMLSNVSFPCQFPGCERIFLTYDGVCTHSNVHGIALQNECRLVDEVNFDCNIGSSQGGSVVDVMESSQLEEPIEIQAPSVSCVFSTQRLASAGVFGKSVAGSFASNKDQTYTEEMISPATTGSNESDLNTSSSFQNRGDDFATMAGLSKHGKIVQRVQSKNPVGIQFAFRFNKYPNKDLGVTMQCSTDKVPSSSFNCNDIIPGPSSSSTNKLYFGTIRQPMLTGTRLTVYVPLPKPSLECPLSNCDFKVDTYGHTQRLAGETYNLYGLRKHVHDVHLLEISLIEHVCLVCKMGDRKNNKCLKNIDVPLQSNMMFSCEYPGCGRSYSAVSSLKKHSLVHREPNIVGTETVNSNKDEPTSSATVREEYVYVTSTNEEEDPGDGEDELLILREQPELLIGFPNIDDSTAVPSVKLSNCLEDWHTRLSIIFQDMCSASRWLAFEKTLDEIITKIQGENMLDGIGSDTVVSFVNPKSLNNEELRKLYTCNPRKALRYVLRDATFSCHIPPEEIYAHFSNMFNKEVHVGTDTYFETPNIVGLLRREYFKHEDVTARLRKLNDTLPGPDKIQYSHLKSFDCDGRLLCVIFNICLKFHRIPACWKRSKTFLIPNNENPQSIDDWQPICLLNTIYKLFSGLLSQQFKEWCTIHKLVHSSQTALLDHHTDFYHGYAIKTLIRNTVNENSSSVSLAFLAIKDAFSSVTISSVLGALKSYNVGYHLIQIIGDMLTDRYTEVVAGHGTTEPVHIQRGLLIGDPLSMLLFVFVLNHAIVKVDKLITTDSSHSLSILANGSEFVLISHNPAALQQQVDCIVESLKNISLSLSVRNCVALSVCGNTPPGTRPITITIDGVVLRCLKDFEYHRYFGMEVGYPNFKQRTPFILFKTKIEKIQASCLYGVQKIDAVRRFVLPEVYNMMRNCDIRNRDWHAFDNLVRKFLKATLHLQAGAANGYLHGSRQYACLSFPKCKDEADIFRVTSAYQILTCHDSKIRSMAAKDLARLCKSTPGDTSGITGHDLMQCLNSDKMGQYITSESNSVWTLAKFASSKLNVKWEFEEPHRIILSVEQCAIDVNNVQLILFQLRNRLRARYAESLMSDTVVMGSSFHAFALSAYSNQFLRKCDDERVWNFVHLARLRLTPLRGRTYPKKENEMDRMCLKCLNQNKFHLETVAHVLTFCNRTDVTKRHNAVVSALKTVLLGNSFEYICANEKLPGSDSPLRPDLVVCRNRIAYVIDVSCPYDDGIKRKAQEKKDKYTVMSKAWADLNPEKYDKAIVVPFIIGCCGAWDPDNDSFLKLVIEDKQLRDKFAFFCVRLVLTWSACIMTAHCEYKLITTDAFEMWPTVESRPHIPSIVRLFDFEEDNDI